MASLTPSHLVDSLTSISKNLIESIRNAPSTSVFSSIATVATVYLVLFHVLKINKPAAYRKIPSGTRSILWGIFAKRAVPENYEALKELFDKYGVLRVTYFTALQIYCSLNSLKLNNHVIFL